MIVFFHRASKKNAKKRLLDCISKDRENIFELSTEAMRAEIESIVRKYFDFESKLKFNKADKDGVYTMTLNNLTFKVR